MGATASSHDLLAFAEEIPDHASKDQILKLARKKFPNAEVARMVPLYEAFREEKLVEAVAHNLNRKSVEDISVNGLRVLLRADLDVPRDKVGPRSPFLSPWSYSFVFRLRYRLSCDCLATNIKIDFEFCGR